VEHHFTGPHFAFDWRDRNYFAEPDDVQIDVGIELPLDVFRRTRSIRFSTTDQRRSTSRSAFRWRRSSATPTAAATGSIFALPDWLFQKIEAAGIRLQSVGGRF
jgi:hypothetical protein